jgi:hypothetical protein
MYEVDLCLHALRASELRTPDVGAVHRMSAHSNVVVGRTKEKHTQIEAIPAIETITNPIPTVVPRNVKIVPPVPPFVNGMISVLAVGQLVRVGN